MGGTNGGRSKAYTSISPSRKSRKMKRKADLLVVPALDLTSSSKFLQTPTVLHVPYTFFPDACGGTEVYVRGLAQCLASRGYPSAVAAPGIAAERICD